MRPAGVRPVDEVPVGTGARQRLETRPRVALPTVSPGDTVTAGWVVVVRTCTPPTVATKSLEPEVVPPVVGSGEVPVTEPTRGLHEKGVA